MLSFLLGRQLGMELLGYKVNLNLTLNVTFQRATKLFSEMVDHFTFLPAFSALFSIFLLKIIFFITAILVGIKQYLIVVLIPISLMINGIDLCDYWPLIQLFWRNVFSDPLCILK